MSRQTVNRELRRLVGEGLIRASGRTQGRRYTLAVLASATRQYDVANLTEDLPWQEMVAPALDGVSENVRAICQYGTTEMVNNVIDHSASPTVTVHLSRTAAEILVMVTDQGVGVFRKIAEECHLDDERHAILQLAKGKITTDATRHTGEGIFFTARMCDRFTLASGGLALVCKAGGEDWLLETHQFQALLRGTLVALQIDPMTSRTAQSVFARFASGETPGFFRTHVPLSLARQEGDHLVSRSQAKRMLVGIDKFSEVVLDFKGVTMIGQAFADEIFRVFQRAHPNIHFTVANASEEVQRMVAHVLATSSRQP